jgi:hypothetical protein
MNGRQLADEARRRCPKLKVLFTTRYTRNAIIHHGRLDPGVEMKRLTFKRLTFIDNSHAYPILQGTNGHLGPREARREAGFDFTLSAEIALTNALYV